VSVEDRVRGALHAYGDCFEPDVPHPEAFEVAPRHSVRWRLAAAVMAVAALGMGAVLALGTRSHSATTVVATAAATTAKTGSFRFSLHSVSYDTTDPGRIDGTGDTNAVVNLGQRAMHLTTEQTSFGQPLEPLEVITIGNDQWTKQSTAVSTPGQIQRPWIHRSQSSTLSGFDPVPLFDRLKSHHIVRDLGPETVGGIDTEHYAVEVGSSSPTKFGIRTVSHLSDEVWVSGDHLVRRLKTTNRLSQPHVPDQTQQFEFDFTDFGQGGQIQPPPSDQVEDLPANATH
jgi:hypothetical protein